MTLQLLDLLAKGYFPKELPPPFSTTSFSSALADPNLDTLAIEFSRGRKHSMLCMHNLVRAGGLRRNLGIPNPKHFFLLAKHVFTNWNNFIKLTSASPFSLTKPVAGGQDRAISPEHDFSERTTNRARLRSMNRFLLKSDISRFFPSIYTHSIPWAIMGKANAKANLSSKGFDNSWENITDVLSRSLNNNQTIGIPIGPDTSLLLAEVILSRIDTDLARYFNELQGMRFIDDYEFYFATRSEADRTLSYLQHLLNDFELALNPHKTAIIELPDKLDTTWTSKIRCFNFRYNKGTGQKNDITSFFDMVFDFNKLYPEEALIKYAIGRLRGEDIDRDNWEFFEQLLSHCVLIEPACIPQVCYQIVSYQSLDYTINQSLWRKCLNRIVFERTPLGQSSEAAWAMWMMKVLNIRLERNCAETVANSEDSIVGLMALGLADQGLACKKDLAGLNRFSNISGFYESQWLLCYQGNLMGWLGGRADFSSDDFFSYLKSRDVSFFNIMIKPLPAIKCIYSGGGGDGY